MPLFGGKKFAPKKPPMRKQNSLSALNTLDDMTRQHEFGVETGPGPIELRLGGHQVVFENGEWISSTFSLFHYLHSFLFSFAFMPSRKNIIIHILIPLHVFVSHSRIPSPFICMPIRIMEVPKVFHV